MQSPNPEGEVGVRGPFSPLQSRDKILELADGFIHRTGLLDYAHYIRVGAFLARRPFGEKQVKYLEEAHKEEDEQSETTGTGSQEHLDAVRSDLPHALTSLKELRNWNRQYEYKMLRREGNRGRWQIFWRQSWRVYALVLCCSLGAAIQGWDESAVNGAQLTYQKTFHISERNDSALIGAINAAPYLMCIFSCSLTEPLNHYLGRKGTIMFCCLFSFASCLGQAFCQTPRQLLVCRLLLGFGIGPKSATIPIYAAESVPSEEIRGALVMSWQLWTAFGIMLGYVFTYVFGRAIKNQEHQWRFMIASPMIAPAVLFFLMMSLPESPRWHLLKARRLEKRYAQDRLQKDRLQIGKHYENAFYALRTLRHTKLQAARDLFYIDRWLEFSDEVKKLDMSRESEGYGLFRNTRLLLREHRCRRAMTAGLIVMALQQLCGVNVFAYYSSPVFKDSIPDNPPIDKDHNALGFSLGFGIINFIVAIPAAFLIDKVGRRLLLLTTFPLMGVFQLATGLAFGNGPPDVNQQRHIAVVVFAYCFCVVYSIGEGPVPLVYASECLPLEVRDTGVGILTGIYWGLNSLMALTWPPMYTQWRPYGSFVFYAALNFIGWFLIVFFVPETSRYTLEELHEVFSQETKKIMNKGWAQVKWLVTGVGERRGNYGRWVRSEYPSLVPRFTRGYEQELKDLGGLASRR